MQILEPFILVRSMGLCLGFLNVCMATANRRLWSHNAQAPVWQHLQQQLLSDIGQERLYHNTESVVPATVVYLMSKYEKSILKSQNESNDGILNIHLIGATYLFEGLSDWKLLADWVPQHIHTIRIDLILGSPFQEDGPSKDEEGRRVVMDVPVEEQGQVPMRVNTNSTVLLQVNSKISNNRNHRRRKIRKHIKLEAQDLRKKSCWSRHLGTTGVKVVVKCQEKLYQDVWDIIPKPQLAMMINPGFPLPHRRSFDGVLRHLLKDSIPTAVSAQQIIDADLPWQNGRTPGVNLALKKDFDDEAYQTFKTLQIYDAQVVATSSPFPFVYKDPEGTFLKNNVLEFFVGRKPDATPIKMLPPMHEGRHLGHERAARVDVDALETALRTPVSRPYAQAMTAWARSSRSRCKEANTVQAWVLCCHGGPEEIEC